MTNRIWTLEKCLEIALTCKTSKEWYHTNTKSYYSACKNKWLSICNAHMKKPKPKGYWDFENCKLEASKYNTRKEWYLNSLTSYNISCKNKWLDVIASHMEVRKQRYWTKEDLINIAKNYRYKSEWYKNDLLSYKAAHRKDVFKECSQHMRR